MTRGGRRILASAAMVAVLGGCHHEEKATGHGTISGQILPGSVSDAMLPYDSVKSKAPLAPPESVEPSGGSMRSQPGETTDNPGDNAASPAGAASAADSAAAAPTIAASPAPVIAH